MKKMKYVAPSMTVMSVELEHGFMAASVVDDKGKGAAVKSVGQEYESIDFDQTEYSGDITWD